MKTEKRIIKTTKGLKKYTYLGCPLTRNKTAWCYRICQTDMNGNGFCGRVAPHSLRSTIQVGIENYNKKLFAEHHKKLENMYLKKYADSLYERGIDIIEGEVEILSALSRSDLDSTGLVKSSVCSKLLLEAAELAVNSKILNYFVTTEQFHFYLSDGSPNGNIITRSKILHKSGEKYFAESVIVDEARNEIARGNGLFQKSNKPLD